MKTKKGFEILPNTTKVLSIVKNRFTLFFQKKFLKKTCGPQAPDVQRVVVQLHDVPVQEELWAFVVAGGNAHLVCSVAGVKKRVCP